MSDRSKRFKILISDNQQRKRPRPDEFPQALPPRSPDRQAVQIPPAAAGFGGYPATSREYAYYGAPVKRTRTSIDYGRQSLYPETDARMARPMETYAQPAAMYGQPNAYQNPAMQYSTGQVVPDYGVRVSPQKRWAEWQSLS